MAPKAALWRRDYSEQRPQSAIGDKCPIVLRNGAEPYGPQPLQLLHDPKLQIVAAAPRLGLIGRQGRAVDAGPALAGLDQEAALAPCPHELQAP